MRRTQILPVVFCLIGILSQSCNSLTKCESIERRHMFLLLDVSDPVLYAECKNDLSDNLPTFMDGIKIASITDCEQFSLSVAHLSGIEQLDISTKTIGLERRGLSGDQARKETSPKPLIGLLQEKLREYDGLVELDKVVSQTNIGNILLKCVVEANVTDENTFVVFTDGIENNGKLNLYKGIPDSIDMPNTIERLFDPLVLAKYRNLQQAGLQASVVVVLKNEPNGKMERRKVKAFWKLVFNELDLPVQFIDNLSNRIDI